MTTYISILRGINVSGHRLIKMDALKQLCASLKLQDVQTYIQSGNLVFSYKDTDTQKISTLLQKAIEDTFGFEVPVITLTRAELQNCLQANPFLEDKTKDPSFLHLTFLSGVPAKAAVASIKLPDVKNDQYEIIEKTVYLFCPDGYGQSKLTNTFWESKLKVTATTRNWKTVNELLKMAEKNSR